MSHNNQQLQQRGSTQAGQMQEPAPIRRSMGTLIGSKKKALHDENATRKIIKRRPAPKQVEEGEVEKKAVEQTGQTYNVWYHKWAGGDRFDGYNAKTKSQTRCKIERDIGYTRADTNGNLYCCLYFARGCCPKGSNCTYLHRLPMPDTVLPDASLDVFGREKHSDYRDDMGGVGSFGRQNRTLYVGKMHVSNKMEETLLRHFEEWGDIERIKILQARGVGFVTYFSELSAQFAKEAMMNQSLDNDEVINVRWATEDPNPAAKTYEYKRLVKIGQQSVGAKLTPEFIAAVRKMDELEGRVAPLPEDPDDVRALPQGQKRLEIEGSAANGGAGGDGDAEVDGQQDPAAKRPRTEATTPQQAQKTATSTQPSQAKGLLSGSALDSLKKAAALRKAKQQKAAAAAAAATTKA